MPQTNKPLLSLAIAEKDNLVRKALINLLATSGEYNVIIEADSPASLLKKMDSSKTLPLICIIDVKPGSVELVRNIRRYWPKVKVLVLSSLTNEHAVITMIKSGVNGYLHRDCKPQDLYKAINDIHLKGYYYSKLASKQLFTDVLTNVIEVPKVNNRQIEFLTHCCSGSNYAEIAAKMKWSVRTIDGYRDGLFAMFNMRNRTDLVLFALRAGIVELGA